MDPAKLNSNSAFSKYIRFWICIQSEFNNKTKLTFYMHFKIYIIYLGKTCKDLLVYSPNVGNSPESPC